MKNRITSVLVSTAALFLALSATTVTTASASPTDSCARWSDQNTFGAKCSTSSVYEHRARVFCANGVWAKGPWKKRGQWSYAYCTAHDSTIKKIGGVPHSAVDYR